MIKAHRTVTLLYLNGDHVSKVFEITADTPYQSTWDCLTGWRHSVVAKESKPQSLQEVRGGEEISVVWDDYPLTKQDYIQLVVWCEKWVEDHNAIDQNTTLISVQNDDVSAHLKTLLGDLKSRTTQIDWDSGSIVFRSTVSLPTRLLRGTIISGVS